MIDKMTSTIEQSKPHTSHRSRNFVSKHIVKSYHAEDQNNEYENHILLYDFLLDQKQR